MTRTEERAETNRSAVAHLALSLPQRNGSAALATAPWPPTALARGRCPEGDKGRGLNRILNTMVVGAAALVFTLSGCGGNASTSPDAQVSAAVKSSARELEPSQTTQHDDAEHDSQMVTQFTTLLEQLRALPALAPLFAQYQVPDPMVLNDDARAGGLVSLLQAVQITLSNGTVTITNRQTGGVIFSAPVTDLASGVFHPENLPTGTTPPTSTCTYAYSPWSACQSGTQTRTVTSATPAGCTGTPVLSQPCTVTPPSPPPAATCTAFTYSTWGACQPDGTQTRTIISSSPSGCTGGSPSLSQSCTYTPPVTTCSSFTYSAWGACQPDGTQTRTVASSSPTGCTGGSPVLSQACTYTPPPDGAALYTQSCAGCHGALASSNLKGKGISVSMIKSFGMTQGLNDAQLQAIVTAVGP